ncbi:PE-PPE domain-containing protein [Mycolicibacterium agri]|nr:PE-PPE domain-containing protein [Mycolicibacterium agri]GFG48602.1 hypothetical protein MAGR_00430 [Mycolicibacterium agri]
MITSLPLGRFYLLDTREEGGEPLSILGGYDVLNHMIGENWFPSSTAQVVNYPASIGMVSGSMSAPVVDDAVEIGRRDLDEKIRRSLENGETTVVIAGLSQGTLVINRELAYLADDPHAPPPGSLTFVMFSSPEIGLANIYLPVGTTLPIINYTVHDLADSQYDVSVVYHQYEFWSDFPDRPWNLLAVVNSFFSMAYYHNNTAMSLPDDAVVVSSRTNEMRGTTTTYMIPSDTVPMLKPLQQLGVPARVVDWINAGLKPAIDSGYSRLAPDAGPTSHTESSPALLSCPRRTTRMPRQGGS